MIKNLVRSILACALLSPIASAQFLGVTISGDFLRIDGSTGIASLEFSTGISGFQGMTYSPTGRIWCIQRVGAVGGPRLFQVDTVLGTAGAFHPTQINDAFGLALSPNGTIYVTDIVGSVRSRLYTIDLSVPNSPSSLVGEVKIGNQFLKVLGMTFSPSGTLYGWSSGYGLVTIDPFTALAVDLDGQIANSEQMQSLTWAPDGWLYGGYESFYRIDPSSGAVTLIGGPVGFGGFRGVEYFNFAGPTIYCDPKPISLTCVPAISVQGSTSMSGPDNLVISASEVLPKKSGILILGSLPQRTPFAGGSLCVAGAIQRVARQVSGGTSNCNGSLSYDFTHATMAKHGLLPGASVYAQWMSRYEGLALPDNVGLTDAAEITLQP